MYVDFRVAVTRGWFARDYYRALLAEKRELEAEQRRVAEMLSRVAETPTATPTGPTKEDMQVCCKGGS